MIRPLTIATCLLACGSGLYLYQSKHEVQLLDRTIDRTVHETSALREQSRLLATEWTMLNEPGRLRQFSDTYLGLKSIAPTQFTSLNDLNARVPAPRAEMPQPVTDEAALTPPAVSETIPPGGTPDPAAETAPVAAAVADESLPVPPVPAAPAATSVAVVSRPVETRAAERVAVARPPVAEGQVRPVALSEARASDLHPADQRPGEARVAPRVADAHADVRTQIAAGPRPIVLAAPRPLPPAYGSANAPVTVALAQPLPAPVPRPSIASARPPMTEAARPPMTDTARPPMIATARPPAIGTANSPIVAVAAPYSGSLLGMARGSMPPAPRPTPVMYNSN